MNRQPDKILDANQPKASFSNHGKASLRAFTGQPVARAD